MIDVGSLRGQLGLSRAELAQAFNVNKRTVYRWETGDVVPVGLAAEVLRAIARAIEEGADAAQVGRRIALGIGALLYYGLQNYRT